MSLNLRLFLTGVIDVNMNDMKMFTTKELQAKWQKLFNSIPPKGYTKSFLIKEITWQINYGKMSANLQSKINKLVEEYEKTKSVNIKKVKRFNVTTGTKFIREFRGEKYEIVAVDGGFDFNGKTYKTLSAVANVITGTHWNGKKFFGVANG